MSVCRESRTAARHPDVDLSTASLALPARYLRGLFESAAVRGPAGIDRSYVSRIPKSRYETARVVTAALTINLRGAPTADAYSL